jgi:hypothetical protein
VLSLVRPAKTPHKPCGLVESGQLFSARIASDNVEICYTTPPQHPAVLQVSAVDVLTGQSAFRSECLSGVIALPVQQCGLSLLHLAFHALVNLYPVTHLIVLAQVEGKDEKYR